MEVPETTAYILIGIIVIVLMVPFTYQVHSYFKSKQNE